MRGFKLHTLDHASVLPIEEHPCSAIQPQVGMAMVLSGGLLVKATGTTKPTYICVTQRHAAVVQGELIQVTPCTAAAVYETEFAVAAASIKLGSKVTIHTDAMSVTATTEGGIAEVVAMDGTAAGSICRVRLR